jgi:hypothetical protein
MTSSPVESATARPGEVDRVPDPPAGAADPSAAAVRNVEVPKVGGMPEVAVVAAAALGVRLTAAGDATEQAAREGMPPVGDVTADRARLVLRRNEGAPA